MKEGSWQQAAALNIRSIRWDVNGPANKTDCYRYFLKLTFGRERKHVDYRQGNTKRNPASYDRFAGNEFYSTELQ